MSLVSEISKEFEKEFFKELREHFDPGLHVHVIVAANCICERQAWFDYHFIKIPREKRWIFMRGISAHNYLQKLLKGKREKIVEKEIGGQNVIGRIDIERKNHVVEIKTVRSLTGFDSSNALPSHMTLQAKFYSFMTGKPVKLLFIESETWRMKEYDIDKVDVKELENAVKKASDVISKPEPPPSKPIASWACRYCELPCSSKGEHHA